MSRPTPISPYPCSMPSREVYRRLLDMRGLPVLLAVAAGTQLRAYCPMCAVHHLHGAGPKPGTSDGHRAAHCSTELWSLSGYFLLEVDADGFPYNPGTAATLRAFRTIFKDLGDNAESYEYFCSWWEEVMESEGGVVDSRLLVSPGAARLST